MRIRTFAAVFAFAMAVTLVPTGAASAQELIPTSLEAFPARTISVGADGVSVSDYELEARLTRSDTGEPVADVWLAFYAPDTINCLPLPGLCYPGYLVLTNADGVARCSCGNEIEVILAGGYRVETDTFYYAPDPYDYSSARGSAFEVRIPPLA
jgi:hypothetical protein